MTSATRRLLAHPLLWFLVYGFLVYSWPFARYPLTDGDIVHWAKDVRSVRDQGLFLSAPAEQSHGPLLVWTAGLLTRLNPRAFYWYNAFNLLCGLWGIALVYVFSQRLFKNRSVSSLNTFVFATSLAVTYFSRTPMYDWPAAIALFTFCGFYYLAIDTPRPAYLALAYAALGVGSLARFSIVLGLGGIFVLLVNGFHRRSLWITIRDALGIVAIAAVVNAPWFLRQATVHGEGFVHQFAYDNLGRYVADSPSNQIQRDYYAFALYALLGLHPFTSAFIASWFQAGFLRGIRQRREEWVLLAGFLPCLLLFSFSGHTKLARYMSYAFPFLCMWVGCLLYRGLPEPGYRRRVGWISTGLLAVVGVLLAVLAATYRTEAASSRLFVLGSVGVAFGSLATLYAVIRLRHATLRSNAERYLPAFGILWCAYFTILTRVSFAAPFLLDIRRGLEAVF